MSDPNVPFAPSGNPSTAVTPDNVTSTPATATPVAPPTGVPASSPAPPQVPATGTVPPGYVPSFRIRETRDQYEQKIAQLEAARTADIDRLTKQVQALTGVNPPSLSEEETIRQQLYKVVPDLKTLVESRAQLEELIKSKDQYQQQNKHYWQSYNRTQMDRLFKTASDSYGNPISDAQKRYLQASFVGWASGDPELEARYETDPSIVDEFWKEFSSNFIEPARRIATTSAVGRAPSNLPQDTPSGGLRTSAPPEAPKDLDGRVDLAWQAFKQARSTS